MPRVSYFTAHTLFMYQTLFTVISCATLFVLKTPNTETILRQTLFVNWFFFLFDWPYTKEAPVNCNETKYKLIIQYIKHR